MLGGIAAGAAGAAAGSAESAAGQEPRGQAGSAAADANFIGAAPGAVARPARDKLSETVTLEDLGLVPNNPRAAANNVTFWAARVKPLLDAGGTIYHGPLAFYIDDALPGPTGTNWAYITVPGPSKFIQRTDNREIMRFDCSQRDPADYGSRTCPSNFYLGGFGLQWERDQPVANTRAIGVAFRSSGDVPDGLWAGRFGPGFTLINGRDGIAVHPDTIVAAHNFPIWGCVIDSPRMAGAASGSLLRLGNFGRGGAPKIVVCGAPYANAAGNDGSVPILHFEKVSGVALYDFEFNRCRQNAVLFNNCRQCLMVSPRWEMVDIQASDIAVVRGVGGACRLEIVQPEFQSVSVNIRGGKAYLFESWAGEVSIRAPSILGVSVTGGLLFAAWPRSGGRVTFSGKPSVPPSADFAMADAAADGGGIGADNVQAVQLILSPLAPGADQAMFDPLKAYRAPQEGYLLGLHYEFIGNDGRPAAITGGAGAVSLFINGTAARSAQFDTATGSGDRTVHFAPMATRFAQGDSINAGLASARSLRLSAPASLKVTAYLAFI